MQIPLQGLAASRALNRNSISVLGTSYTSLDFFFGKMDFWERFPLLCLVALNLPSGSSSDLTCIFNKNAAESRVALVTKGYDLGKSNPDSAGGDPGFTRSRIFHHTCAIAAKNSNRNDASPGYYDFVNVVSQEGCVSHQAGKTVSSFAEYMEATSSLNSFEFGAEASGKVSFGFVKVRGEAKASLKQRESQKEMEKFFAEEKGEVVISRATCNTVDYSLNGYSRPLFAPDFARALASLNATLIKSDSEQMRAYKKFTRFFGTHYVTTAKFGASLVYEMRYSKRSGSREEANARNGCLKTAASGCVSASSFFGSSNFKGCMNANNNQCVASRSSGISGFSASAESITIRSKGSRPKSVDDWASDEYNPVPIKMTLDVIANLIEEDSVSASEEYGFPRGDLDAEGLRGLLRRGNERYCELVLRRTEEECNQILTGCGVADDCQFSHACVDDEGEPDGYRSESKMTNIMRKT